MTLSNPIRGSSNAGSLENAKYPLVPSLPDSSWSGMEAPDKGPISGSNITKLSTYAKWIVWNRIFFTFKLRTYAKLNC